METPALCPGDCLHVWPDPYDLQLGALFLDPAWAALLPADQPVALETARGRLDVRFDRQSAALESPALADAFPDAGRAQHRLEVLVAGERPVLRVIATALPAGEEAAADAALPGLGPLRGVRDVLTAAVRGRFQPLEAWRLGQDAWQLSRAAGFDELLCLPLLRGVDLLDHQIRTVRTVLRRHRARALLCDEVGLGKTIEAGMIVLELTLRRMARRVLVLTPSSLVEQWRGELERKFGLDFVTPDQPAWRDAGADPWARFDRVIASTHLARREPHRTALLAREYDLVVIDEAHHLRNRRTALWRLASALRKRFMLLLTATPIQNRLEDVFNLITVLKPGYLDTAQAFRKQFVGRAGMVPRNTDRLRQTLAEVMVRNRRSDVGLRFTRRLARTVEVALPPAEAAFYRELSTVVREAFGATDPLGRLALRTLQAEAGSAPAATRATLQRIARHPGLPEGLPARLDALGAQAAALGLGAKAEALGRLLPELPDKLVIFTRFRTTLDLLRASLEAAGVPVVVFHGSMRRLERHAAIAEFRDAARVLLASDAGSEGQNLQFCHAVCNYDLPWNPMVLEQRVGRLSRIGQTRDVEVVNLVAAGTLEAHVLRLLDLKLRMFELVVGEVEMILGEVESEGEFADRVLDCWLESPDDQAFAARLDRLGEALTAAKAAYLEAQAYDEAVFGDRFVPEG